MSLHAGQHQTPAQWAGQVAADLPRRWRRRVLARWQHVSNGGGGTWPIEVEAERAANLELRATVERLEECTAAGLPLDAKDRDVCDRAREVVRDLFALAGLAHLRAAPALREALDRRCRALGVEPPKREGEKGRPGRAYEDGPAIARMLCEQWWRRQLRKLHARAVEAAAIRMGLVHVKADCYVSTESLTRRIDQIQRNAAALEGTIARNELGQEFTLAELAAKGTANKALRRAELMTRIAGFERIARALGHAGMFMTITCPSRMHKWRTFKNKAGRVVKVEENPRYDGTNPREANEYLGKVWSRIRARLHRQGIKPYGFRIAEPNHDGTPHWHFLVFHEPADLAELMATIRMHALKDSPDEPGAQAHRVDFKPIDWSQGTAAGYIAKYVAKNIDGYRVEADLYGNPALEASARVEAWAATWRIRQFQQVGGPPVGVWRELRRIASIPEGAPAYLAAAHRAVNKLAAIEGKENASVAWDHYVTAQGGVFCGRNYRIRLSKTEQEGKSRYGDALPDRVIGVECAEREFYTPEHMRHMNGQASRLVEWVVESSRHQWEIVSRPGASGRKGIHGTAQPAPWTRVNNCTEGATNGHPCNENEAGGMPRGLLQCERADPPPDRAFRDAAARGAGADGGCAGPAGWLQGDELRDWAERERGAVTWPRSPKPTLARWPACAAAGRSR